MNIVTECGEKGGTGKREEGGRRDRKRLEVLKF